MNAPDEVWEKLDDTSRAMVCAIYESNQGLARAPSVKSRLAIVELLDHKLISVEEGFRMFTTRRGQDVAEYGIEFAFQMWCELSPVLKDGLARLANHQRVIPDCVHTIVFEELRKLKLATAGPAGGVIDGYQICPWGMRLWLAGKMSVLS
jgi:hypothetical protein